MALDTNLELNDEDVGEQPSRVDGFAERLILANDMKEAKIKRLNEEMEQYHKRHANFQFILFIMVIGGIYYLYKIGCWEMIRDFFISMSQTTQ
jgi:hypothetical protein